MNHNKTLRLVAWEITRNCNLSCIHCRASATNGPYDGELSTESCYILLDQIAKIGNPIIILTGGEPLLRPDIFDIAGYGIKKGLKVVMAPNGTLITERVAQKMKETGISRISISIDGATSEKHDEFRGVKGAFEGAISGIKQAKKAGLEFQINTTITKLNLDELPKIQELATGLGAAAHHIFLLVPTGRGKYISSSEITAVEYEEILNWFYDKHKNVTMQLKATCAPQYYRLLKQKEESNAKGCLAGTSFCFISHRGIVQPCGFLDLPCGDVTKRSFDEIWEKSDIFASLRDFSKLKGKCGKCKFKMVCGGCRARAYEKTGDFLEEEPLCVYKRNIL
ncbi:MAG: radical SAM protein [Desulfobacterales bacterium]|nr:radical SAM protein [Desulfobacterales bacterium]